MSVLVTGGAGFIGSHVVAALQTRGEDVIVLDNFSAGSERAVRNVRCVRGDIGDSDHMHRLLREFRVEAVIHLAGSIRVEESESDPLLYYRNNTLNSLKLIEAVHNEGVKCVVYSSTAAVYGEPSENPVSENAPTVPISPYGASKLVVEMMLRDVGKAHGLRHLSLRYFNVAGAHPEGSLGYALEGQPTHLLRTVLPAALERRPFSIFGADYPTPDGTCVRDYIHVWDLANAHVNALEYLRQGGVSGVFNCGYGKGYSVQEVVDAVKRVTGIDFPVNIAPRRRGDPAALVANANRIREELKWVPQYEDLETIIRHQLEWERSQRRS